MDARIPEPIQPLLTSYVERIDQSLPDLITGFYLHGSLALDAFNLRLSDIDFIAVISRRMTAADLETLTRIHAAIAEKYPQWQMQGSYLMSGDLGKPEDAIPPFPHYSDGVLHPDSHHGTDDVMWWLLKHRGIVLVGDEPQTLNFTVDWERLIADMRQNMNTYWASYTHDPKRMLWLLSDYGVQWAVLGVLRQLYTFRENDIISKTGAGTYALEHVPARWHTIIQEAIRIREGRKESAYKISLVRAVETVKFLKYIIASSNEIE